MTCDHGLHQKFLVRNVGEVCIGCDPSWADHGPVWVSSGVPLSMPDGGCLVCDEDCGHESWGGLMRLLDEHWPDDIFPTKYADDPKRDAGPRIVSLMRLVDKLIAERDQAVAAVGRVREVLAFYDRHEYSTLNVDDIRRALDDQS